MTGWFWNDMRDRKLRAMERDGHSASEIGAAIGCTRNAVIGRSSRLRGKVFPCDVIEREEAAAKRKAREDFLRVEIPRFKATLRNGMSRRDAIMAAHKRGLSGAAMGRVLGVSRERISQIRRGE